LLQQTPSVVTTSDAGAGVGYTGIRIRGSGANRTNVTINGVPVNDAESHGVFWVNMPDLASSLESIQIQRGIGTSTNGAGAFGATINMETTGFEKDAYGEINNSFGSFNTRKHTVKVGSGLIDNKFQFEGRLSEIHSDGYIDRASSDLQSYYLSGAYYGKKTIIKAITFGGKERTYQSWYGTPQSRLSGSNQDRQDHINRNIGTIYESEQQKQNLLNAGRTYNYYLYSNQVDNYNQDHYQLHFSHEFSKKVTANLSLHYTRGEGYYEEYKYQEDLGFYNLDSLFYGNDTISSTDLIRRRWLDNDFYGFTYSVLYDPNSKLSFNLGGGLNNYEGDHFGRIIWSQFASNSFPTDEYYFNVGEKLDGNAYLKTNYQLNSKVNLFADMQVRTIQYEVNGIDNDQRMLNVNEDFLFFNPKIGANYKVNDKLEAYLFAGIGNREPNRSDFIDQNPNTPPSEANEAETMRNIETGVDYRANKYQLAVNLYLMDYDNQLVNTGQLNDVGSSIRQNVDRSYRAGVEVQAGVKATEKLTVSVNATYSQNKIQDFKYTLYDYTNGYEVIERELGTTDIALSPEIIANGEIKYQLFENLEIALLGRYIGDQYLDNTSSEDKKIDAYLVSDFRLNYKIPTKLIKNATVKVLVNNVFSEKYSANGYTYSYIYGQTITENFYYPQAFRNYLVSLDLKF
jgi:iron complex outermembrane receptor protein